jgi:uncharacterized membrane protein SpoIIM required for sporulation
MKNNFRRKILFALFCLLVAIALLIVIGNIHYNYSKLNKKAEEQKEQFRKKGTVSN